MATSEGPAPRTSAPQTPAWAEALIDDAGLFPPEELSMTDALARHRHDLAVGHPALSHRFICPIPRLAEVIRGSQPDDRFRVLLLGSVDSETVEVLDVVRRLGTVDVVGLETRLDHTAAGLVQQIRATRPDLEISVEVPLGSDLSPDLDLVAAWHVQAKVRCGGVTAEAFPAPEALARFVVGCVRRDLPFKATAGLHHALSHTDPVTGFAHLGFANLLAATAAARHGAGVEQVAQVLTDRHLTTTDPANWAEARGWFRSFGSCSTSEPLADLADLERV